ncbi:lipoyl(octanoyl) transferase LipB [Tundrisphaera lichenicola]|uniref:lipoyl(octanoyl) transferase LipB n=1 Tax=Tundrisphaera lichenicola TaxID=2029860 RepID=UPI003EBC4591
MNPSLDAPPLEIYLLGTVDFDEIQQVQRRLVYDLGENERAGGALILCEHPPTISVGRSGSRAHILADDPELRSRGMAVRWINRGGGCVLHLPGQLVGYLAMPLNSSRLDLQSYIEGLHRVLVEVLAEFDLPASTQPDQPGVFLGQSRVGSVGVAVSRWIAYHGFTLNVSTFLEPFEVLEEIRPGPSKLPIRQTSMESRRQRPAPMAKVREAVIRRVESVFGLERHHLYTHHPLIRRKVGTHAYASSLG